MLLFLKFNIGEPPDGLGKPTISNIRRATQAETTIINLQNSIKQAALFFWGLVASFSCC